MSRQNVAPPPSRGAAMESQWDCREVRLGGHCSGLCWPCGVRKAAEPPSAKDRYEALLFRIGGGLIEQLDASLARIAGRGVIRTPETQPSARHRNIVLRHLEKLR